MISGARRLRLIVNRDFLRIEPQSAVLHWPDAGQNFRELGLAVAIDAGNCQDFTGVDLERYVF